MTSMGRWEDAMKAWMDAYRESDAGKLARGEIDALDDAGRGLWRDAVGEVEEIVDILKYRRTARGEREYEEMEVASEEYCQDFHGKNKT
ncbi:hypothetical protein C8R42DRAFT_75603 [Lentinula raphanica]|nr:hypothetical protein C8R42DRAFT_75603 [Lentinula raphanica]